MFVLTLRRSNVSNYDYSDPDLQQLSDQAKAHAESIMNDALEHWRSEAIRQYPNVEPLREYLTEQSKEKVLELAKDLSSKLPSSGPHIPAGSPALGSGPARGDEILAEAQVVESPRGGGAVMVPGESTETERLKARARNGDTSAAAELASIRRREAGWSF
jgi:hypothetical protein